MTAEEIAHVIYDSLDPEEASETIAARMKVQAERVAELERAAFDLMKDYAWLHGGKVEPRLSDDSQWKIYSHEHPISRLRALLLPALAASDTRTEATP